MRKGSIIDCGCVWDDCMADDRMIESADLEKLLILPLYAP
jgi:hypothetical protein